MGSYELRLQRFGARQGEYLGLAPQAGISRAFSPEGQERGRGIHIVMQMGDGREE